MIKIITTLFFILCYQFTTAQEQPQQHSISKNITGIQAGFFGVDLYNEFKLFNIISLRTDFSLYSGIGYEGSTLDEGESPFYFFDPNRVVFTPIINLQPKVYYNLTRRVRKGKNIDSNGANYFSLNFKYVPNWFVITKSNAQPITQFYVVPTFGIRRNFAKKFNYEFKAGLGGGTAFHKNKTVSTAFLELSFKLGYDFYKKQ
ncbi:MAG: hypothetical protein Q4C98_00755 [Capnocytophaga sp.]|nr:hypothetical protein [Capnocytophaga sp.]